MKETARQLYRLTAEINALYHAAANKMRLADSTLCVLYMLCDFGGSCSLGEICRMSGSKQTVNSAIRKMEKGGLIYLTADGGKKKTVHLTQDGQTLAGQTVDRLINIENKIIEDWSEADCAEYGRLLQKHLDDFTTALTTL